MHVPLSHERCSLTRNMEYLVKRKDEIEVFDDELFNLRHGEAIRRRLLAY